MKRIINLDWLAVYCLSSSAWAHEKVLLNLGFQLQIRGDGTRHFHRLYDVIDKNGEPFLEIQDTPKSLKINGGIWKENAMLIKVYNKQLYKEETVDRLYSVLLRCGIKVKSISRLDIAMDFNYFDNHIHPQTLIREFMNDKLWYLFVKKFYCIGKQSFTQTYEYLRFGSSKSSYSVYLYNKSRELKEQKDKPYIRDIWEQVGLNQSDVWRLEISLRTDAKGMVSYDDKIVRSGNKVVNVATGQVIDNEEDIITDSKGNLRQIERINLDSISNSQSMMHLYMRMINHLFHFRVKVPGKKKSKSERLELIKFDKSDTNYRPYRLTYSTNSGRTEKIVMNYLDKLVANNDDMLKYVYEVKREIITNTGYKLKK